MLRNVAFCLVGTDREQRIASAILVAELLAVAHWEDQPKKVSILRNSIGELHEEQKTPYADPLAIIEPS